MVVAVMVLGDLGRSPRMQYHVQSLLNSGHSVHFIGYLDTPVTLTSPSPSQLQLRPIASFPKTPPSLFLLMAPFKVIYQIVSLFYLLLFTIPQLEYLLVQNPPSIPTLMVAQSVCALRSCKLIIDWHNLGYSILAMKLAAQHPILQFAKWLEKVFGKVAYAHVFVSQAMGNHLVKEWGIQGQQVVLYDRPPKHFRPLQLNEKEKFIASLKATFSDLQDFRIQHDLFVVSSTSWTADEDFGLLLASLVDLDRQWEASFIATKKNKKSNTSQHQRVYVMITGKGPMREEYEKKIQKLDLKWIRILTGWFSMADYVKILGSADIGISLHTSSSGLDLPMKVVDMFGCGLPVLAYEFECISELVDSRMGQTFQDQEDLTQKLMEMLTQPKQLQAYRANIQQHFQDHRWEVQWNQQLLPLFQSSKKIN